MINATGPQREMFNLEVTSVVVEIALGLLWLPLHSGRN